MRRDTHYQEQAIVAAADRLVNDTDPATLAERWWALERAVTAWHEAAEKGAGHAA